MARAKKIEPSISLNELEVFYRNMNRICFAGYLPDNLPIRYVATTRRVAVAKARVNFTTTKHQRRFNPWAGAYLDESSLAIEISTELARTPDQIKAILLHEMIHVYFHLKGDFGQEHGPEFMKKLKELSDLTGFDIPVTEELDVKAMNLYDTEVGVVMVQRGVKTTFAILTAKATQGSLEEIIERITRYDPRSIIKIYLSRSRIVQEASLYFKTQRNYSHKTKFYSFKDHSKTLELVRDLEENGKLIRST